MTFTVGTDEGCLSGCYWRGGSQCSRCGARLRCGCGRFVREDQMTAHIETCAWVAAGHEPAFDEAAGR